MSSDKSHTDLGTKEIYKRHAVMVEGGNMPRAKVMDQTLIALHRRIKAAFDPNHVLNPGKILP